MSNRPSRRQRRIALGRPLKWLCVVCGLEISVRLDRLELLDRPCPNCTRKRKRFYGAPQWLP